MGRHEPLEWSPQRTKNVWDYVSCPVSVGNGMMIQVRSLLPKTAFMPLYLMYSWCRKSGALSWQARLMTRSTSSMPKTRRPAGSGGPLRFSSRNGLHRDMPGHVCLAHPLNILLNREQGQRFNRSRGNTGGNPGIQKGCQLSFRQPGKLNVDIGEWSIGVPVVR